MTLRPREVLGQHPPEPDPASAPDPQRQPEAIPEGPRRGSPRSFPIVCASIIAGSVAMFFLDNLFARPEPGLGGHVLQIGALYGPAVVRGEWWRLALTALEHGGPVHLALNMSAVFTLGIALERAIGSWRMAAVSWISTMGSSLFALFFAFDIPTIGASGTILGWLGALLPIVTRESRRSLGASLLQVAIISLLPGISWQAHLGGVLFGLVCGFALRLGFRRFTALAPLMIAGATALAVFTARFAASR